MKYKKLKDFTIREFELYKELSSDVENNLQEIFDLFEIEKEFDKMSINEFNEVLNIITSESPENSDNILKDEYMLNDIKYSLTLNLMKINAAQFINTQNAVASGRTEKILACFLIPMIEKKNIFGNIKYSKQKYGGDYSTIDVENDIFNYMKIGDSLTISFFFTKYIQKLLTVYQEYSVKKNLKQRMKIIKQRKKLTLK